MILEFEMEQDHFLREFVILKTYIPKGPYIPDLGPQHDLLYIFRNDRDQLIIEAEWPDGLKPVEGTYMWSIRKSHPSHKSMVDRYATRPAYRRVLYSTYEDLIREHNIGQNEISNCGLPDFIEPDNRIYLYINRLVDTKPDGSYFERTHQQFYIPKNHPEKTNLIKKFGTEDAQCRWLSIKKFKKENPKLEPAHDLRRIDELGPPRARIKSKKGPKPGPTPDSRITLRMFAARVKKCWITTGMPKQAVAQLISEELFQIGTNISPSMVLKHIEMGGEDYETLFKRYAPPD